MSNLLIGPYSKEPVAVIEESRNGRNLKIFDKDLQKTLEVNGITQSEKRHGVWRVFPDGNPQIFLEAFEKDFFHGLAGKGYYWISQKDYNDRDSSNRIEELVNMIIQAN